MIDEKPKNEKSFYKELTSTQLFQMFIQNSLFPNDDKKPYFEASEGAEKAPDVKDLFQ